MPTTYALAELTRLADITPRTVRYYISQGLLPSPGSGPSARYTDVHLARLRLIRRLQRDHLPLAEIRRRLDALPDDQLVAMANATDDEPRRPADTASDYVRRVLARPFGAAESMVPSTASLSTGPALPAAMPPAASVPSSPATSREAERSTWERHTVAPEVEIHVRRPLDRHTSRQVDRLIRIARDLLGDES